MASRQAQTGSVRVRQDEDLASDRVRSTGHAWTEEKGDPIQNMIRNIESNRASELMHTEDESMRERQRERERETDILLLLPLLFFLLLFFLLYMDMERDGDRNAETRSLRAVVHCYTTPHRKEGSFWVGGTWEEGRQLQKLLAKNWTDASQGSPTLEVRADSLHIPDLARKGLLQDPLKTNH